MSTRTPTRQDRPKTPPTNWRTSQLRVIASEWTKFRSLRSTIWTLVIGVVLTIGAGVLFSAAVPGQYQNRSEAERYGFDATDTSLYGILFCQLALGILGVMLMSAEYSSGMIRSTLAAVPARLPVLWAKLSVFAAVTILLTLIASIVAFLAGQAVMSSDNLGVSLSSPGAVGKIVGAALYVTLAGLIGIALGSLLRNTAAGISTYVAVFVMVPLVAQALPASIGDHFVQYLPSNAGGVMFGNADGVTNALSPITGFLVLTAFTAVLIGGAAWRLKARDA